ncbi:N-acetyl-D-glucosamine kinase-like isoform X2 [Lineus longissimus]
MVNECKQKAGLDATLPITSLGLSLSGGYEDPSCSKLLKGLKSEEFKNISENYYLCNDTKGSLATISDSGGIVLIAGTGSNCLLINPDGSSHGCGGWGHQLGDEGSAYWISQKAMKTLFDHDDGLVSSQLPVDFIRKAVYNHFAIKGNMDILEHMYTSFDKSKVAKLCKEIARGGLEENDPLCCQIFKEAGHHLGRHVQAVVRNKKTDKSLLEGSGVNGCLQVVCVGSVWKSWKLLRNGFLTGIEADKPGDVSIPAIELIKLTGSAAYGAAFLGAKSILYDLPIKHFKYGDSFFMEKKGEPAVVTVTSH